MQIYTLLKMIKLKLKLLIIFKLKYLNKSTVEKKAFNINNQYFNMAASLKLFHAYQYSNCNYSWDKVINPEIELDQAFFVIIKPYYQTIVPDTKTTSSFPFRLSARLLSMWKCGVIQSGTAGWSS